MSDEKKMFVSLDQWVNGFAQESIKMIKGSMKGRKPEEVRSVVSRMIKHLAIAIIDEALKQQPTDAANKQDMYAFVKKNLSKVKYDIQNDIAQAFAESMTKYSKKPQDYFCQVLPSPEPTSKLFH